MTGVQIDSRRVEPGDLFVAVRGGVDYLDAARAAGAAATLVPDDDYAAMAAIGRAVRDRSSAEVVGITGSTGKTSTKDILAALVRPHRKTIAAEASYNAELGVPLTLCPPGARHRGPDRRARDARLRPDRATSARSRGRRSARSPPIGPVHLEFVGDVAGVARAKAELLEALPPGATAVIPAGVPELEPYLRGDLTSIRVGEDARLRSWTDGRLEAEVLGEPCRSSSRSASATRPRTRSSRLPSTPRSASRSTERTRARAGSSSRSSEARRSRSQTAAS